MITPKPALIETLSSLKAKLSNSDAEGFDDLVEQSEAVLTLLKSDTSVQNLKKQWLSQLAETDRLLAETNKLIELGLTSIGSLVNQVNNKLAQMKDQVTNDVDTGVSSSWVVIFCCVRFIYLYRFPNCDPRYSPSC